MFDMGKINVFILSFYFTHYFGEWVFLILDLQTSKQITHMLYFYLVANITTITYNTKVLILDLTLRV